MNRLQFVVDSRLDQARIAVLLHVSSQTVQKTKTHFLRGTLFAAGSLALVFSLFALAQEGFQGRFLPELALGILLVSWGAAWDSYVAWKNDQRLPASRMARYTFHDKDVTVETAHGKSVHAYTDFSALAETENAFVLFLDRSSGYVFFKEDFVEGDPNWFAEFLHQKTGKTVPFVKLKHKEKPLSEGK